MDDLAGVVGCVFDWIFAEPFLLRINGFAEVVELFAEYFGLLIGFT